jgi:hypothetical protein
MDEKLKQKCLKVSDYTSCIQKKGFEEFCGEDKIDEGSVYWTVKCEDGYMDVRRQEDAEILGRLIRIERLLRKKIRKLVIK